MGRSCSQWQGPAAKQCSLCEIWGQTAVGSYATAAKRLEPVAGPCNIEENNTIQLWWIGIHKYALIGLADRLVDFSTTAAIGLDQSSGFFRG